MAGTEITIQHNIDELRANIKGVEKRLGKLDPALKIIGATVEASVLRNFEKGGRPTGWTELSPVTLAKKKGGSILVGKGHGGGLMGSIHSQVAGNIVMVGTDKVYAAIHQFGGMAGRNKKVKIPARPFLMVQDKDWDNINEDLSNFILQGKL